MSSFVSAQSNDEELNQLLIYNPEDIHTSESVFAVKEIVEICKYDTTFISKLFNKNAFNKKIADKYIYNMLADSLSRKLLRIKNEQNQFVIDRIIKELDYDKNYTKPKVDWGLDTFGM